MLCVLFLLDSGPSRWHTTVVGIGGSREVGGRCRVTVVAAADCSKLRTRTAPRVVLCLRRSTCHAISGRGDQSTRIPDVLRLPEAAALLTEVIKHGLALQEGPAVVNTRSGQDTASRRLFVFTQQMATRL